MAAIPVFQGDTRTGFPAIPDAPGGIEIVAQPLSLFGFEFSLDTGSLDALESVARAVTKAQLGEWFARFGGTEEVGLFVTCHRVEVILLVRSPEEVARWRAVLPGARESWKLREGRELVRHLVCVAAGRKSLALGELEVRQQMRAAARQIESRHPRPVVRAICLGAADAADEAFPPTPSSRSIAAIATEKLRTLVGDRSPQVLVVGAGTVGLQVAQLLARSSRVTIVYHARPPDPTLLEATGIRAIPLARLPAELATTDVVVTAAKFGDRGVGGSDLPVDHPLVLLDLGMPRNIDPAVRQLPNVRLVDLEELHAETRSTFPPGLDDARTLVHADRLFDQVVPLLLEPWIDSIRSAAEEIRRAELANARPYLGRIDADQEVAIERLTRRLVAQLLLGPTERVRSLPPGPEGDYPRQVAVEVLRPRPPDP